MARKQVIHQGAPDWVLTYGDLMSLLLCFFILLAAFANFDTPNPKVEEAIQSIRAALGIPGSSGTVADPQSDFALLLDQLRQIVNGKHGRQPGDTDTKGVQGSQLSIREIRDGAEVAIGGPIAFDRFSAELKPAAAELVVELAGVLRGHLNKIEVRGHATREPLPPGSSFRDPMDLSIARARAVATKLIENGVALCTIRVVGAGDTEPVVRRAYSDEQMAANRRVEVVVRESVAADYDLPGSTPPPDSAGPSKP